MNKFKMISILLLIFNFFQGCSEKTELQEANSIKETVEYFKADLLKPFEGVWIEENYLADFSKSKSPLLSKNAFESEIPVGIRINLKDLKSDSLYIGYSTLHSHSTYLEKAGYIKPFDEYEPIEGNAFNILLNKRTNDLTFETTEIPFFTTEKEKTFITFKINKGDTSVVLFTKNDKSKTIKSTSFKRVLFEFSKDYQDPNPLYFLLRKVMISGNYSLLDSTDKVLSENVQFLESGQILGFEPFKDYKYFISSEFYCGPRMNFDEISLFPDSFNQYSKSYNHEFAINFGLIRNDSIVELKSLRRHENEMRPTVDKLVYKLKRK